MYSSDPPPFHFFKDEGGGNLITSPRRGIWKIEKRWWKYSAGAGLFKRRGARTFLFNAFKVYHFYI